MTGRIDRRAALAVGVGGIAALITSRTAGADMPTWWLNNRSTLPPSVSSHLAQQAFAQPIGAWQAGDIPHAYPLPDDRVLWLLNDSFLSDSPNGRIDASSTFVRNAAIVQSGSAMELIDTGRRSFAADGESLYDRWWWFHGGEIDGSLLHVVTTEMTRTGEPGWAINFEPTSTWITTIAWRTMSILRMRPAMAGAVEPVYGFSVASDDQWTYLFGNDHLYGRGTTENRVARVPRGKLLERPTYWDGASWADDPSAAVSVLTSGTYACRLNVIRAGSRWIGTSKDDEFFGTHATIWTADQPTGPWTALREIPIDTKTGDDRTCTYDVMARRLDDGRLLVWWSNNAYEEALTRNDPSVYRPTFTIVDV